MAQTERHRHGSQTLIAMAVLSGTVIEKGDFVGLAATNETVVNVGAISDSGDEAANRESAQEVFLGIAQTASADGETEDVMVDISLEVIHELTLESAANLSFGDLIEIYSDSGPCEDQTTVAGSTSEIAVCVKPISSGVNFLAKLLPQKILNTPAG